MDHVPEHQRGKFAAIESIKGFNWGGSAVVGGLLVESYGIRVNFLVSASVAFLGVIILLWAHMQLVRKSRKEASIGNSTED
jgi:predicted MFS family arabinose efflux permease